MKIFTSYNLSGLQLKNRVVMAPMTRSRAIGNIPNDLMAEYYSQRASGGLLITEGTAPSANGLGYARIPGLYSDAQVEGWKKITAAVHAAGGLIFAQLMHTGRVSHPLNMEPGAEVVAPSAIRLETGNMYTDAEGPKPYPVPKAMTAEDIEQAQNEYVQASKNAIAAGFDGIELHGANGYLIDQFINTATNQRTDTFGGSIENRNRFVVETAQKVAAAIGPERTGIRLSPYGVFNGMEIFDGIEDAFEALAGKLGKLKLAYIHIVDHSAMGAPPVTDSVKEKIKNAFGGTLIASGGLDLEKAEKALNEGVGELTAFGRPYIANPDLVERMKSGAEWAVPNHETFYTPGPEGYTDYPVAN